MSSPTTPPKMTAATAEEIDSLQRSKKKCKTQQPNANNEIQEENMVDAQNTQIKTIGSGSFKDALLKQHEEVNLANECLEELIEEDFPENHWYKDPQEAPAESNNPSFGPVIPVIDVSKEELQD